MNYFVVYCMMLQFQLTPLYYAAGNGHHFILEYLISCRADVNAVANVGLECL